MTVRHDLYRFVRGSAVLAAAVLLLASTALSSCALPSISTPTPPPVSTSLSPPSLIIGDSVAGDFRQVAEDTWTQFLAKFAYRQQCFGDVRLKASRTLTDRAAYDPDSATVTVRVPGTVAMLQSALVHEWAHHVEFQCPEHEALREPFMAAQGFPAGTPWRPDALPAEIPMRVWKEIPSENYAEATVELVLGRRQIPTGVRVKREALAVLAAWVEGR